jgi:pimeloyl-ACP methyl ester carboxylesterase
MKTPRPRRRRRRLKTAALTALVLGLIGAGLWFRPGFTLPIRLFDGGRSIASLEPVVLGGARQWVLIRGEDRSKPILLFLHDRGESLIALSAAFQRPLERDFVVVQWDRRGQGKSSSKTFDVGAPRTSRELADAGELLDLLRRRFNGRRVIVVGHGYGAYLGAALAQARPDAVRAIVGVGQEACAPADARAIQDSFLRREARLTGDARAFAVASSAGGDDPARRRAALLRRGGLIRDAEGIWRLRIAAWTAPEFSLPEQFRARRGLDLARTRLVRDGPALPLARGVPGLAVPTYVLIGRYDYVTPSLCAERFMDSLQAPAKAEIWFDKSAHYPFIEEPARFREELLRVVAASAGRP